MTHRALLVEQLWKTSTLNRSQSVFKAYLMDLLGRQAVPDTSEARKIAQEIVSIGDLERIKGSAAEEPYVAIFRTATELAFPKPTTDTQEQWEELKLLIKQLPDTNAVVSDIVDAEPIPTPQLSSIIEHSEDAERALFEYEIAKLERSELEMLVVELGVYDIKSASNIDRDFLESAVAEVRWASYLSAYKKILGHPSMFEQN